MRLRNSTKFWSRKCPALGKCVVSVKPLSHTVGRKGFSGMWTSLYAFYTDICSQMRIRGCREILPSLSCGLASRGTRLCDPGDDCRVRDLEYAPKYTEAGRLGRN